MKSLNKKDKLNLVIIIITFLIFILIITRFTNYYGSLLDWEAQHIAIPNTIRTLFYQNFNLFPDFILNIGAGQNIYYLSYYGLFNPYILISYFLPFIKMVDFISVIGMLIPIISAILTYIWLRKRYDEKISFMTTILFIFSMSLSFHSHRHIMFINYMPFLILGLFGIDKKYDKNESSLLVISIFLIAISSFYYSISSYLVLIIYYIFKYLEKEEKIVIKDLFFKLLNLSLNFIHGILLSSIVLLPTAAVILNGREKTSVAINFIETLIPKINLLYFLYNPYGVGLTLISIVAIIYSLISKDLKYKFLSIILFLIMLFPVFNYILNALMYIDAKILIPFLPLIILVIANFFSKLTKNLISDKELIFIMLITTISIVNSTIYIYIDLIVLSIVFFLYKKFKKDFILHSIMLLVITVSVIFSLNDPLVDKKTFDKDYQSLKNIVNYIKKNDKSLYRIAIDYKNEAFINQIFDNSEVLISTIYSSLNNKNYSNFYYEELLNNIKHRNRVITTTTLSDYYLSSLSNKYIVTKTTLINKKLIKKIDNYNIYLNEEYKPMFYFSNNLISEEYYDKLKYYQKPLSLMNYDVVKEGKNDIDLKIEKINDINLVKTGEYLEEKDKKYSINLGKVKTLFVRINMYDSPSCKSKDTYIDINNIRNKLTCKSWKYHNKNYTFDYLTTSDVLNIKIKKGKYYIKDYEIYEIKDFNILKQKELNVEYKDSLFTSKVSLKEDGYFITSIPYDKGFKAYIDKKEVEVEKVNKAFVGFKVPKGEHSIVLKFTSPLKKESLIITFISFIVYLYLLWKEKNNEKLLGSKLKEHNKKCRRNKKIN